MMGRRGVRDHLVISAIVAERVVLVLRVRSVQAAGRGCKGVVWWKEGGRGGLFGLRVRVFGARESGVGDGSEGIGHGEAFKGTKSLRFLSPSKTLLEGITNVVDRKRRSGRNSR